MKDINKVTLVVSKIFEVIHWIGVFLLSTFLVFSIVAKDDVTQALKNTAITNGSELGIYGFDVNIISSTGEINMIAITLFFAGAAIIMGLMAMVFRNIYLIIKTIKGKNKSEKLTTPFQKDIIRMLKEIGIFSIAVPVVGLIISTIICAVSIMNGIDGTEVSVNIQGFMIGLVSLCLTNIFTYGEQLEKDVDGLL